MCAPRLPHLEATYHVRRYLSGTSSLDLFWSNRSGFALKEYCDFDWASCAYSRKTISGFVLFLGGCPVS